MPDRGGTVPGRERTALEDIATETSPNGPHPNERINAIAIAALDAARPGGVTLNEEEAAAVVRRLRGEYQFGDKHLHARVLTKLRGSSR